MTKTYSVFLAHGRHTPDEEIDAWVEGLRRCLQDHFDAAREKNPAGSQWAVAVTSGRDDYLRNADAQGGWDGWMRHVAQGRNADGAVRYHGIYVPGHYEPGDMGVPYPLARCGKATASIIDLAKMSGKDVVVFIPQDDAPWKLHRLLGLSCTDRKNNQSGWKLDVVGSTVAASDDAE